MRKVWEVILDLVYEDSFQFFGPIAALVVVWLLGRLSASAWLGVLLFLLVALSLFVSLRREHRDRA